MCDPNSVKIDPSFKYNVIFGISGARSLFCALFISCFREGRNIARKRRGGISP